MTETPFPIARNNDELIENIKNFNFFDYQNKVDKFISEKRCIDDGLASERVVKLIENIINNE